MDPVTISVLVTLGILLIDRIYNWTSTITKSQCCCCNLSRDKTQEVDTNNDYKSLDQFENKK